MRVAVVLGSSAGALEEFAGAQRFLEGQGLPLHAICVNDAIKLCPVKPHAFCTVISSQTAEHRFLKGVDVSGVLMFARRASSDFPFKVVKPKWQGTSGLYAVQVALEELGFDGVILAGCPMDAAAGTLAPEHSLMTEAERVDRYRPEWLKALPEIGSRTRSMSGWTRKLLGAPDAEWLASLPKRTPPAGVCAQ
jgi:hypothetical protein